MANMLGPVQNMQNNSAVMPYVQNVQQPQTSWWDTIKNFFLGTPEGVQLFQKFTPEQQGAFSQLLQGGLEGLQNPYQGFEDISGQAQRDFQSKTIPSILQQFAANGGNKNSSGLQGALGAAGNQMQQGLSAMKQQFGNENRRTSLAQAGLGLQPQFESALRPRQSGFGENALNSVIKLAPFLL